MPQMLPLFLALWTLFTGLAPDAAPAEGEVSSINLRDTVPEWVLLQMRVEEMISDIPSLDRHAESQDVLLRLYTCGEDRYCFANIFQRDNSQSHGAIYGFEADGEAGGPEYPHSFRWMWTYRNTYDDAEGLAMVALRYHSLEPGTPCQAEIIPMNGSGSVRFTGVLDHVHPDFGGPEE